MLFVCCFLHNYSEYILTSLFSLFQINTAKTGLLSGFQEYISVRVQKYAATLFFSL